MEEETSKVFCCAVVQPETQLSLLAKCCQSIYNSHEFEKMKWNLKTEPWCIYFGGRAAKGKDGKYILKTLLYLTSGENNIF
jgi:hypothetical protein